jgi:L-lactate dehydrogenase
MVSESGHIKIAIIGVGAVGATAAYALMISGIGEEIVLVDVNEHKAEGEAMDLAQGAPFVRPVNIRAGKYADCAGAQVVVITAGAAQRPGESRLDLVKRNAQIFRDMVPQIAQAAPEAVLLIVANPVDILTYASLEFSGFPPSRVIGSGTVLDTARLRALISQKLQVDPRSVHAYVIGEHGDSEVVAWSRATVAGMPINEFCSQRGRPCDAEMQAQISAQVRRAAYEIIERKGATFYAIGLSIRQIVESILRNQNTVLSVSTLLTGQLGVSGVCLSLPAIVCRDGVEAVLVPGINDDEADAFRRSGRVVRDTATAAGF